MKVKISKYHKENWSNQAVVDFLLYLYGPISIRRSFTEQRVRMDESRKLLNEVFVLPNLSNPMNSSFMDRYKALELWDFNMHKLNAYIHRLVSEGIELSNHYTYSTPYANAPRIKFKLHDEYLNQLKLAISQYLNHQ